MPKSPPPYLPELRRRLVELVGAGRSPAELAKEFEPSEQCIRNWVKQADRDAGKRQDGSAQLDRLVDPAGTAGRGPGSARQHVHTEADTADRLDLDLLLQILTLNVAFVADTLEMH